MTEVSDEPIIVRQTDVGVSEGRRMMSQTEYTPPLDGSDDDFAMIDCKTSDDIKHILDKKYFGYEWKGYANIRAGIVGFQIPRLMGPTAHFVINLKQYGDLTEALILWFGGELLDRMGLPTNKFGMEEYLKAEFRKNTFEFGKIQ